MGPQNGRAVNFGFTGHDGIVISGISGTLLQTIDQSAVADKEEVRILQGDIVGRQWFDPHAVAALEWIIGGATNSIAAAVLNTTLAAIQPGTIISITECLSQPDLVGSNWEVMSGVSIKGSTSTNKRLSVTIEKRAGITQAAPP